MGAEAKTTERPLRPIDWGGISCADFLLHLIVTLIILNNLVYQSELQLFQPAFILIIFALLLMYAALSSGKASIWFYSLIISLFAYLIGSVAIGQFDQLYANRALFNFSTAASYLIILFFLSKKRLPDYYLQLFSVIFLLGGIYILVTSDRDLFNPNFYAMTMFYLVAMSRSRRSKWLLLGLVVMSIAIYGSRGAFLSFSVALLALVMSRLVLPWRNAIAILFVAGTLAMFYFIDFLYLNQDNLFIIINDLASGGRGLGGREGALVEGYSRLVDSGYLGNGIGASTSFNVEDSIGVEKDVHVHFGLLDIALKFGFFGVVFAYIFSWRVIQLAHPSYLPFVLGGLMTVFYYNGLATSHLGMNLLLYLFLGQTFHSVNAKEVRWRRRYVLPEAGRLRRDIGYASATRNFGC